MRVLTNRSSGKMGIEIAREADNRGGEVHLVLGNTFLDTSGFKNTYSALSANSMLRVVSELWDSMDIFVSTAAVCDYRPVRVSSRKLKKGGMNEKISLQFCRNKDILMTLSGRKRKPFVVGMAAESGNLKKNALEKMKKKSMDMIAANSIRHSDSGPGAEHNRFTLIRKDGRVFVSSLMLKSDLAGWLWDHIEEGLKL